MLMVGVNMADGSFTLNLILGGSVKHKNDLAYEHRMYFAVSNADLNEVEKILKEHSYKKLGDIGRLSKNPLQNVKYHHSIATAITARFCICNGMSQEEAYGLSDYYILNGDEATSIDQLERLYQSMCRDYANHMDSLMNFSHSTVVCQAKTYIDAHIDENPSIDELADYVHMSKSYLQKVFQEGTGKTIHEYISSKRIDISKALLLNSDDTIATIAHKLGYSQESHFSSSFKKACDCTPTQFRKNLINKTNR